MTEPLSLQAIFTRHLDAYRTHHPLDARRLAVCRHLCTCRTAALGGLQLRCDQCPNAPVHYFSCRDRHCPQCQQHASHRWCERQQQHLLPVCYFHLVFTLPAALNGWVQLHPETIYRLLFGTVWATLKTFGGDPRRLGGELGMSAILHTWGQTLTQHVHLHCLVPGGALDAAGEWQPARSTYLFPVRALSRRFRGCLVSRLREAVQAGELPRITDPNEPQRTLGRLMQHEWVVYSRPALGEPRQVLDYLARYTHRTAIGNHRLLSENDGQIRFRYKDYRDSGCTKVMALSIEEFMRRFLLHVLPKGLMRIRHYGFLANCCRRRKLAQIRAALASPPPEPASGQSQDTDHFFDGYPCNICHRGWLRPSGELAPQRGGGGG